MRISDWSSDVCSADLRDAAVGRDEGEIATRRIEAADGDRRALGAKAEGRLDIAKGYGAARRVISERSEEHTSELQSLMRISYAVFCLKQNNTMHKRKKQLSRTVDRQRSEKHNTD